MSRYRTVTVASAFLLAAVAAVMAVPLTVQSLQADAVTILSPPPAAVPSLASAAATRGPGVRVSPDAAAAYREALTSSPSMRNASLAGGAESRRAPATTASRASSGKQREAERLLRDLVERHPILEGARVSIASTPGGQQAVTYYTVGLIVVDPSHRAGLARIMEHEAWHLIDWRDNGRIDWGEDVPR